MQTVLVRADTTIPKKVDCGQLGFPTAVIVIRVRPAKRSSPVAGQTNLLFAILVRTFRGQLRAANRITRTVTNREHSESKSVCRWAPKSCKTDEPFRPVVHADNQNQSARLQTEKNRVANRLGSHVSRFPLAVAWARF